jgi:salicylate hydroxylase
MNDMVIVGGGIGGMAAALACGSHHRLSLLEQAPAFGELGAGIQLGPNVTRILAQWGMEPALNAVAAFPERLEVRSALSGTLLGTLPLGARCRAVYGAPYATIARQDLHRMLHDAVIARGAVNLQLNTRISQLRAGSERVCIDTPGGGTWEAASLLGADGVWSVVRQYLVSDGGPRVTGHLAYRAMVPQAALPAALRSGVVTAWLGPRFHAVQYPVRSGDWLNVVVIVHGAVTGDPSHWDHSANAGELRAQLAEAGSGLLDLLHAIDDWRLWALSDRPPMQHAREMASGRLALLGDAAHPMRPYLAQGAGMAIEDAHQLSLSLQAFASHAPSAFAHYAAARWHRNARVQARAIRNGGIFHLRGPMRLARDAGMKMLGERLLDVPWLYGYKAG